VWQLDGRCEQSLRYRMYSIGLSSKNEYFVLEVLTMRL